MAEPLVPAFGIALAEFLDETARDDAPQFLGRVGAGLLLLHESALFAQRDRPEGDAPTLSFAPDARTKLSVSAFRVLVMRGKDRAAPFVSVGRTATNDIVVPDDNISRFHAYFRVDGDVVTVLDAGSRNGTFVNDMAVPARGHGDPVPVPSGASVRFGSLPFTFLAPAHFREFVARLA